MFLTALFAVTLAFSARLAFKDVDPHNEGLLRGFPREDDSPFRTVDRMEWLIYRPARVHYAARYVLVAFVSAAFLSAVLLNRFPCALTFLHAWITLSFVMYASHAFFTHHSDKFHAYALAGNIAKLRETGKPYELPDENELNTASREGASTFSFDEDLLGRKWNKFI